MQPELRLRRAADFAAVYQRGRSWAHPLLVLKALPNGQGQCRFGFAIGKRIGKAVVRNQVRRRLRAIIQQIPTQPGWDVVVVARGPAATASFAALQGAVVELFRRARLLVPTSQRPAPPAVER